MGKRKAQVEKYDILRRGNRGEVSTSNVRFLRYACGSPLRFMAAVPQAAPLAVYARVRLLSRRYKYPSRGYKVDYFKVILRRSEREEVSTTNVRFLRYIRLRSFRSK